MEGKEKRSKKDKIGREEERDNKRVGVVGGQNVFGHKDNKGM
jgi:hypothetical protein